MNKIKIKNKNQANTSVSWRLWVQIWPWNETIF